MQKNQTNYLTYGSMMIALFAILLAISVYVPFLGFITSFIVPLPIAWYSAKFERKHAIFVTVIAIIISFIIGGVFGFVFGLLVGPLGFIIGDSIRNNKVEVVYANGFWDFFITYDGSTIHNFYFSIKYKCFRSNLLEAIEIYYEQIGNIMASVGQLPKDYDEMVDTKL